MGAFSGKAVMPVTSSCLKLIKADLMAGRDIVLSRFPSFLTSCWRISNFRNRSCPCLHWAGFQFRWLLLTRLLCAPDACTKRSVYWDASMTFCLLSTSTDIRLSALLQSCNVDVAVSSWRWDDVRSLILTYVGFIGTVDVMIAMCRGFYDDTSAQPSVIHLSTTSTIRVIGLPDVTLKQCKKRNKSHC